MSHAIRRGQVDREGRLAETEPILADGAEGEGSISAMSTNGHACIGSALNRVQSDMRHFHVAFGFGDVLRSRWNAV
ncbi:hypothetical protein BDD21_1018 [Thiocapsa rosea]|uniref:Uncharacterized protein n=1 Tax=Thiocapsa rosea TaxID=69360 RepID=A0A495V2V3_9GAMM|nr:hypothetical protein BDD21_1018 [Thiocapsa rosea]